MDTRGIIEAAAAAAQDARYAERVLADVDGRGDQLAEGVAKALRKRIDDDRAQVDRALDVIFGAGGIAERAPAWVADAIERHYLEGKGWDIVAEAVSYSAAHVRRKVYAALDLDKEDTSCS